MLNGEPIDFEQRQRIRYRADLEFEQDQRFGIPMKSDSSLEIALKRLAHEAELESDRLQRIKEWKEKRDKRWIYAQYGISPRDQWDAEIEL